MVPMSMGAAVSSISSRAATRASAIGAPPVWRPMTTTSLRRPSLRSMISWAIRRSARWMSSRSITWLRAVKTPP